MSPRTVATPTMVICTRVKGRIFLYFDKVSESADFFSFSAAPTFFFPVAVLLLFELKEAVLDLALDLDFAPPLNSSRDLCVANTPFLLLGPETAPQPGKFASDVESETIRIKQSDRSDDNLIFLHLCLGLLFFGCATLLTSLVLID